MKPAEASLPSDTEVLVKRSFDAPVKLVWRAYMEPDLMRRWCSGLPGWSMPVCEMDMRVGGKYRWRWRSDENGPSSVYGRSSWKSLHSRIVHTQDLHAGDLGVSMECTIYLTSPSGNRGITNMGDLDQFASKADRDAAVLTGMTDGMEMRYNLLDVWLAEGCENVEGKGVRSVRY